MDVLRRRGDLLRRGAAALGGLGMLMALPLLPPAGASAAAAPVATAATTADVPSCKLGAYLSDLYDLNPAQESFSARVWLWTLCPDQELDPLPRVSYSNAASKTVGEPAVNFRNGQSWDLLGIQGTFRHNWDVHNFPFDKHVLTVVVTAPDDIDRFRFAPDDAGSSFNREIVTPGWRITGFRLVPVEQHYTTGFSDPGAPTATSSTYSRMVVQIDLHRSDPIAFWNHRAAAHRFPDRPGPLRDDRVRKRDVPQQNRRPGCGPCSRCCSTRNGRTTRHPAPA